MNFRFRKVVESFELLFPRACLVCDRPLYRHKLCFRCRPPIGNLTQNWLAGRCRRCFTPASDFFARENNPLLECATCTLFPPLQRSIRFLWEYGGLERDLIRAMKYRPSLWLAKWAGNSLAENIPFLFEKQDWDFIVPVPCSPNNLKRRLFNQCHIMAREIQRNIKTKPPIADILKNVAHRLPQARLNHDERLRNLKKMYALRGHSVAGRRILLVEDVLTTGATTAAATNIILEAGAYSVDVIGLACAHVWSRYRARLNEIFPVN